MKKITSYFQFNVAFRTVFIYLILSILWILLTDALVFGMELEPEMVKQIQNIKGLLFVGISTVLLYFVVNYGIVQQEKIFSELMKSEQRFRSLIDSIDDYAIFMLDELGYIKSWNKGAEKLTGYSGHDIVGKHFSVFYTGETYHRTQPAELLHIAKEQGKHQENFQVKRKNGSYFWAHSLLSVALDNENNVLGFAQVLQDITERQRIAEKEKKYQMQLLTLTNHLQTVLEDERGRISREIHDDLGQRMTVLRMDISLMMKSLESVHDPAVQEVVQKELPAMAAMIDETIQSMRKIIRDLRPETLDTLGLLNSLRWQADEFARRTTIPVSLQLPSEKVEFSKELSIALFRFFQEALTNIQHHAYATRVHAELLIVDGTVRFTVQDNGKGISFEERNKLNSFGILGIRERARALGGNMFLESEKGKGTILTITVPLRKKELL